MYPVNLERQPGARTNSHRADGTLMDIAMRVAMGKLTPFDIDALAEAAMVLSTVFHVDTTPLLSRGWQPINTAPIDGSKVWVYTAGREGLPPFEGWCAYHQDAGWCTDELRVVTHWQPGKKNDL